MTIIIHVAIALLSLGAAGTAFLKNSRKFLKLSYTLTVLTVLSGMYLVVVDNAAILHTCTVGMVYLLVVITTQAVTHRHIVNVQTTETDI